MSLINEALKKAQRQRGDATTNVASGSAATPATPAGISTVIAKRRTPPLPVRTLVLLAVGGGALLVMGGIAAVIFLWPHDAAPAAARSVATAPRPVVPTTTAAPTVVLPPPTPSVSFSTPTVVFPPIGATVSPSPAVAPTPQAPPNPLVAVAPLVVAPVLSSTPPAPEAPPVKLTPQPDAHVYAFLDTLKVTGIRVSDTDAKVLMNDRVFRLNDLVDRATGLRLTKITAASLTFTDANGLEYTKNF